jgi:alanine-synthesizing transaminase
MFSTRVPADRRPNRVARAAERGRDRGRIIDLTVSNPTRVGIRYPPDLLTPLAGAAGLTYTPAPFGLEDARQAVADYYAARGVAAKADRIVLTASTSEAYSILFKLLCNPGSAVLTPVPSYPLFDHLTMLDGVEQRRYALEYHGRWVTSFDAVDGEWKGDVRALLAVSPNNPTGSTVSAEVDELASRCARKRAALILDEVFCDYPLARAASPRATALSSPPCLTFRLGGLSKSAGLPQVKLSWIAVDGPESHVREALDRLELICDTYLSVSTPVQVAARALMDRTAAVREQILERIRRNHDAVRAAVRDSAVECLASEAGWSIVLRVPATRTEEALVLELIEHDGVLVHPGYFFDFPHEAFLVVSLLCEPDLFDAGIRAILERVDAT